MPKNMGNKSATSRQLSGFFRASREAFGGQYAATGMPSVLIAQNMIEKHVEQGIISHHDGLAIIRDRSAFAEYLLKAENDYQKREDQKVHSRMAGLEHNTHWKAAAAVSMITGTITGLAFAVASPFITTLLQPTADELLNRKAPQQTEQKCEPLVQNIQITNNNCSTHGIGAPDVFPHKPAAQGKKAAQLHAGQR